MLFLLRRIRRKLMQKNKFTTYLLYALGEIVLVVIGILIAVSLNNWNNRKIDRALEIKYLKELKRDLTYDLLDIDFNINFNESRFNSNQIVFDHLRNRLPYHDSLNFHLSNLVYSTRTLPKVSGFESLKSKGLEIISNDSLRSHISLIYSVNYTMPSTLRQRMIIRFSLTCYGRL